MKDLVVSPSTRAEILEHMKNTHKYRRYLISRKGKECKTSTDIIKLFTRILDFQGAAVKKISLFQ